MWNRIAQLAEHCLQWSAVRVRLRLLIPGIVLGDFLIIAEYECRHFFETGNGNGNGNAG